MATATKSTRATTKIQPLADRVVVRPIEDTNAMRGGLHIPDIAKEKPQRGTIIAVGPGRFERSQRVPMELKEGQNVLYGRYTGSEIRVGDEDLLIIKESEVLAVVG